MPSARAAETGRSEGPSPVVSANPIAVREELERILESRHFRHSKQGKRFLQYIVEESLNGNAGLLKERLLGAALFGRVPDYATGDDPIVRVQANDVRRRLEAYAAENVAQSRVLIELAAGSYVPLIRIAEQSEALAPAPGLSEERQLNVGSNGVIEQQATASFLEQARETTRRPRRLRFVVALCVAGVLCAMAAGFYFWHSPDFATQAPENLAHAFWQPFLSSPNPIVISIGNVVVYRPTDDFFRRYKEQHPGTFDSSFERLTHPLPLRPNDPVRWGDLELATNQGFSLGSMRSAMNVAGFLTQHHKTCSVRLGVESSFAELRNAPAILIGAFNNRWTMEMTSGLHFTFAEKGGQPRIREETPSGREWTWQMGPGQQITRDYGLVTRLIAWKTGQTAISVGGLGHGGTTAATELVTNPGELAEVLKSLPKGWEQKNLQFVISADTTDGEAGRPTLVAYYVW
jgi:hypothetical protein